MRADPGRRPPSSSHRPARVHRHGLGGLPDGLYEGARAGSRRVRPAPLYVTENGAAFADVLRHDGERDDPDRVAYLAAHLDRGRRAIEAGVPLAGYFVWSLLDNFEWAYGYSKRFGMVYVDYPTLARIPKSSLYRDFDRSGSESARGSRGWAATERARERRARGRCGSALRRHVRGQTPDVAGADALQPEAPAWAHPAIPLPYQAFRRRCRPSGHVRGSTPDMSVRGALWTETARRGYTGPGT